MHSNGYNFTALLIYVDDMIITGNDAAYVVNLKQVLDQKFGIKDLSSLKYFLGLEIASGAKGISLKCFRNTGCQSLLVINSLLAKFFKSLCYDRFYCIQQVNMS